MVTAYFCKHGSDVPWCKRCEEVAQAREEGRRQGIEEAAKELAGFAAKVPTCREEQAWMRAWLWTEKRIRALAAPKEGTSCVTWRTGANARSAADRGAFTIRLDGHLTCTSPSTRMTWIVPSTSVAPAGGATTSSTSPPSLRGVHHEYL